jgi:hypothetical protein
VLFLAALNVWASLDSLSLLGAGKFKVAGSNHGLVDFTYCNPIIVSDGCVCVCVCVCACVCVCVYGVRNKADYFWIL